MCLSVCVCVCVCVLYAHPHYWTDFLETLYGCSLAPGECHRLHEIHPPPLGRAHGREMGAGVRGEMA